MVGHAPTVRYYTACSLYNATLHTDVSTEQQKANESISYHHTCWLQCAVLLYLSSASCFVWLHGFSVFYLRSLIVEVELFKKYGLVSQTDDTC